MAVSVRILADGRSPRFEKWVLIMIRLRNRSAAIRLFVAATAVMVTVAAGVTSTASASTLIALDEFNDKKGTKLENHPLDSAPSGSAWEIELGDWVINKGTVQEKSKARVYVSSDYRAVVDVGEPDVSVSAVVKRGRGDQYSGVVGRYAGPVDWVMLFHDGVGDLVLGSKEGTYDFVELGRVPYKWKNGKVHILTLTFSGDDVTALIDGDSVIETSQSAHPDETYVGIFSRGRGKTSFQQFSVTAP